MADIPVDTQVYLTPPVVGVPDTPPGQPGRPFAQLRVVNDAKAVEVRSLIRQPAFALQPVAIRQTERGLLTYDCGACGVWTLTPAHAVREEWLFVRQETDGAFSFSLSNAPADTTLAQLRGWRCQRYFAERTYQDAKSEGGWAELVARKYRA